MSAAETCSLGCLVNSGKNRASDIYKSHIVVYIYIYLSTHSHTYIYTLQGLSYPTLPTRPNPSARRLLLLRLGVNKKWGSCNMAVDLSFVAAGDWLIGYHQLLPDAWENPGKTRGKNIQR